MIKFLKKQDKPNFYFVEMNKKKKFIVKNEEALFKYVVDNRYTMAITPRITNRDYWPLLWDCDIKKSTPDDISCKELMECFVKPYLHTLKKKIAGDLTYIVLRRNCGVRKVTPKNRAPYYKIGMHVIFKHISVTQQLAKEVREEFLKLDSIRMGGWFFRTQAWGEASIARKRRRLLNWKAGFQRWIGSLKRGIGVLKRDIEAIPVRLLSG